MTTKNTRDSETRYRGWVLGLEPSDSPICERAVEGPVPATPPAPPPDEPWLTPKRPLVPNGPEVFVTPEWVDGRSLLIVDGVYAFNAGTWVTWWARADAVFACDAVGRFVVLSPGVRVGRKMVPLHPVHEDRERHRYVYVLTCESEKVSVCLHSPADNPFQRTRGYLTVSTCPATDAALELYAPALAPQRSAIRQPGPFEILLVAERTEQMRRDRARAAEREAENRREARERQRAAWIESQVREYEDSPHYADEAYLRNLGATNTRGLMQRRGEFNREWEEFHADPEAIRRLKAAHPEIYERARYKRRATAFAEQIAAAPNTLSAQEPPRKKETPEQYQERQTAHRKRLLGAELSRAREEKRAITALGKLGLSQDQYDARVAKIHEMFAAPDPNEEAHNAKKI